MASYLITYDLDKPGQDYSDVLKTIKNLGGWARLSESSYVVSCQLTVQQIYDRLKQYLDNNDQLYVIHVSNPWTGFGPKDVNDWLNTHLD